MASISELRSMDIIDEPADQAGGFGAPTPAPNPASMQLAGGDAPMPLGFDRRRDRRHDLIQRGVLVERWDGFRETGSPLGELVDLSASGVLIAANANDIRPGTHLRLRLRLPQVAGISPFVDATEGLQPSNEWTGWMEVARVVDHGEEGSMLGGRLLDMEELDRGMLKLYLSIHPLAA
ncbi:MAG: PilZ domain-containing protein [Planctomycetota bacterium]